MWWYLYVQVHNAEMRKREFVNEIFEAVLPWLNPEMYLEMKKHEETAHSNIDFENQMRAMFDGTWNSDPDAQQQPHVDNIASSRAVGEQPTGEFMKQLFEQGGPSGTIKDAIFPGAQPPVEDTVLPEEE